MLQFSDFNIYKEMINEGASVNDFKEIQREINKVNKYVKSFGNDLVKVNLTNIGTNVKFTVKTSHFTKRQGEPVMFTNDDLLNGDKVKINNERIGGMYANDFNKNLVIETFSKANDFRFNESDKADINILIK